MKSLPYHEHLVSMLGYVPDKKNPLLLVEFCEKGDLLHFIRERKNEIIEVFTKKKGKSRNFLKYYPSFRALRCIQTV